MKKSKKYEFLIIFFLKKKTYEKVWCILSCDVWFIVLWLLKTTLRSAELLRALANYQKYWESYNNKVIMMLWTLGLLFNLGRISILTKRHYRKFWRMSAMNTQEAIVNFS